jgi:hypothetical protein
MHAAATHDAADVNSLALASMTTSGCLNRCVMQWSMRHNQLAALSFSTDAMQPHRPMLPRLLPDRAYFVLVRWSAAEHGVLPLRCERHALVRQCLPRWGYVNC